jgi:hypothetical protein
MRILFGQYSKKDMTSPNVMMKSLYWKKFEEFSTSSIINEKPQVIFSNGQDDVSVSTSSPTHESIQGDKMVSRLNDHSCHTSTSSCPYRTDLLKEEVCDRYRPNEESTSSPHIISIAEANVCIMAQDNKNLTRVNDFLLESHERQEELLIEKIKELKALTKEHEKLKDSHASLVSRYENFLFEQPCATNSIYCVAQLEKANFELKAHQLEDLTS